MRSGLSISNCSLFWRVITLVAGNSSRCEVSDPGNAIPLVVAQGKKPVLLGRNWLEKLNLDWSTIAKVSHVPAAEDALAK